MIAAKIDHEAEAEKLIVKAARVEKDDLVLLPLLAEAQVHATLALVEQQARTADALDALTVANLAAARIAWMSRPGWRANGGQIDWMEGQLGMTGAGA